MFFCSQHLAKRQQEWSTQPTWLWMKSRALKHVFQGPRPRQVQLPFQSFLHLSFFTPSPLPSLNSALTSLACTLTWFWFSYLLEPFLASYFTDSSFSSHNLKCRLSPKPSLRPSSFLLLLFFPLSFLFSSLYRVIYRQSDNFFPWTPTYISNFLTTGSAAGYTTSISNVICWKQKISHLPIWTLLFLSVSVNAHILLSWKFLAILGFSPWNLSLTLSPLCFVALFWSFTLVFQIQWNPNSYCPMKFTFSLLIALLWTQWFV